MHRHRRRLGIALLAPVLVLTTLVCAGCPCAQSRQSSDRTDTAAQRPRTKSPPAGTDASVQEVPMLEARGRVTLTTRDGRQLVVAVEIAEDDRSRARGLMFRRTMPEMAGMIFIFPEDELQSFWMRNTYLPLDMLFIDSGGVIVGIIENAEPLTTTPRRVDAPSRYVLEVNGGWARRHGVGPGDRVALEREPR